MNSKDNPVAWSLLIDELADLREHTESLMNDLVEKGSIDKIEYEIDIAHLYSHLNRAWHRIRFDDDLTDEEWEKASKLPTDSANNKDSHGIKRENKNDSNCINGPN